MTTVVEIEVINFQLFYILYLLYYIYTHTYECFDIFNRIVSHNMARGQNINYYWEIIKLAASAGI